MLKPALKIASSHKFSLSALVLLLFISVVYLVSIQAEETAKGQIPETGFPDSIDALKTT